MESLPNVTQIDFTIVILVRTASESLTDAFTLASSVVFSFGHFRTTETDAASIKYQNNDSHRDKAARGSSDVALSAMTNNIYINHNNGLHQARQTGQLVGQTPGGPTNRRRSYWSDGQKCHLAAP